MDIIEEKNLNYFQKNFKCNNPEQIIPLNLGKKWTHDEEIILLRELDNNIDIEIIAEKHKRTKGGILSRQKEIAYKMYIKNIPMKEIIDKTKLEETTINEFIEKKRYNTTIKKSIKENKIEDDKNFSIENEIIHIKKDIKELKNTLKELVEMIKAIYEFEDS